MREEVRRADPGKGSGMGIIKKTDIKFDAIGKSWKVRHKLAALVIGPFPRQELITDYIAFSVPQMAIIIGYISLPLPHAGLIIWYNARHRL